MLKIHTFLKICLVKKFDLTDTRYVVRVGRRYLPKSQSERIKKFAKHNNNK